ncbi:MAG TPA: alpha-(1-_3)-arabinofuranosyltransferase family protein [Marmoricola sp.]|nr:alpha-(1->3)-arabinofuranosyltransferase family protein [Marmoricola sp.]
MLDQPAAGAGALVEEQVPATSDAGGQSGEPVGGASGSALTSPLRQAGYAAVLVALCFVQAPGLMVADTKFDLLTDPWRFLARGTELWDARAGFGQVPDQAYGYAWPMGPFFAIGHAVDLSPWVVQRLWWALLLCLAFFGILRLTQRLGLGTELTRVVAAFAFVLTPRITTLVGVVSVEVWPMALAPWVLLPLVRGTREGSVRRAAALSALVVVCCGGVNAIAVAAVVPLGLIWILTRAAGPRRWRLLGWWILFTFLGTVWWSGPLLLMGRYAPPFLDYIENASITTLPTDVTRTLVGISDWVAYFGGQDFEAGLRLVGSPYLVVDAALVAALGIAGVCMRDNPHRRFLAVGVLVGLALVGLGYSRDLAGFFAQERMSSLDYALAPLRNLHKFDVVLRVPLVLGLAHLLKDLPRAFRGAGSLLARRMAVAAVALALIGLVTPWVYTSVPATGGVASVPHYWSRVADYLARHDDGSVALELPASSFGVYSWGNVHDDVLQGLARSPWAVRSVVPLAQPGNVVFLDAVTRLLESGRPSTALAPYLAANGVGTLVVRNDLDRVLTGAPDPAYVRSVLAASPGLRRVASFGPLTGEPAYSYAPDARHTRIVEGSGISERLHAVDVYRVAHPVAATLSAPGQVLLGDPSSPVDAGMAGVTGSPRLLAADRVGRPTGQILTDDMKRREMNFPAVRWNESSTMSATERYRLGGKEQSHRVVGDERRWDTVEQWIGGVTGVSASTSQAYADATPPLSIGSHPGAALDHERATSWESSRDADPDGQWWQVSFPAPRTVPSVAVELGRDSVPVQGLRISGGGQQRTVLAPAPGARATYQVGLPATRTLRITALYHGPLLQGSVSLSEVSVDGVHAQRYLTLPRPISRTPVDVVSLSRDPDRLPCAQVGTAFSCSPFLAGSGEDGDTLARIFTLPVAGRYDVTATGSLRRHSGTWKELLNAAGVRVSMRPHMHADPAVAPGAMVDGDPSTTWLSPWPRPRVQVRLPGPIRLRQLQLTLNPGAAASRPARVMLVSGKHHAVVDLDQRGRADLPRWRVDGFRMTIESTRPAFSLQGERYVEMNPGVTELKLNGGTLARNQLGNVTVPCGEGPTIELGGTVHETSLVGNVHDLVRGGSVPLRLCGTSTQRLSGRVPVLAAPTRAWRVDSITLRREGSAPVTATRRVQVTRQDDLPTRVSVPARPAPSLLTLPMNLNPGWQATLGGSRMSPVRVDGWKQAWVLPAGPAGTVHLSFAPAPLFRGVLVAGLALVVVVALGATPLRLRRRRVTELPPLAGAAASRVDLVLVVAVAGLLTGWLGVGLVALAFWLSHRWGDLQGIGGWGVPAAGALLVAVAGFTWPPLKDQDWAMYWAQAFGMLAVACLSVGLLRGWRRAPRRPVGRRGWLRVRGARGGGDS